MRGLFLKDILNLAKNVKQVGVSLVLFLLLSISMKSSSYFISMMMLMSSMLTLSSMSLDEAAKWDKYALTMPIGKKDMVLSKYMLMIALNLGAAVIAFALGIALTGIFSHESISELFKVCVSAGLAIMALYSILFPVLFKLGVEKGRMMLYPIVGLPFLLIIFGKSMLKTYAPSISLPTMEQINQYIYFVPLAVFLLLYISFKVSVNIYEKKEF